MASLIRLPVGVKVQQVCISCVSARLRVFVGVSLSLCVSVCVGVPVCVFSFCS
jgi:hypothetical protein